MEDPDAVEELLRAQSARRSSRDQLSRSNPDFDAVSPQAGELDAAAVADAAAHVAVPGRFQVVDDQLVLDGAHNAAGMAALAESLPAFLAGRSLVAVLSILDDKDASAMLAELLPLCDQVVFCRIDNPRALSPGTLPSLTRQLGGPAA
ncbi:MAG: FolC bifunctional protein, partial [Blastococcus sp.]|nr:FolC bifunctional protein [Blastococcus sp.]